MDVQFSGAVDFSPLFNTNGRVGPQPSWSNKAFSAQESMLQSQNSMLQPLNQLYDATYDPVGFLAVGQNVDIMA